MEAEIKDTKYYGICAYGDKACKQKKIVLPAETKVSVPDKKEPTRIAWSLNGDTGVGYIKDAKAYRFIGDHYEIKRPTDLKKDDGNRYCDPELFEKCDGQLVYSTESAASRVVIGILEKGAKVIIEKPEETKNPAATGPVLSVGKMKDGICSHAGHIYMNFPYPVTDDYKGISYTVADENKKISDYWKKDSAKEKCSAYGLELSVAMSRGVQFDTVCSPTENAVQEGDILGFPGLFQSQEEICHVEVFAPDTAFCEKDKDIVDPCDYRIVAEIEKYASAPTTLKKKAAMKLPDSCVIKLKENGKESRYVSGEEYCEIEAVFTEIQGGAWCRKADMYGYDTDKGWYMGAGSEPKTIRIAAAPENIANGTEIKLYPYIGYINTDSREKVTIKGAKGQKDEKNASVRKIKTYYRKDDFAGNLFIGKKTLAECAVIKKGLSDTYELTKTVEADKLFTSAEYDPPTKASDSHAAGTLLAETGVKVDVFVNRGDSSPSTSWIKVRENTVPYGEYWINASSVGEIDSGMKIERLVYNNWLSFFRKREGIGDSPTVKTFDDFFSAQEKTKYADTLKLLNDQAAKGANKYAFGEFVNKSPAYGFLTKMVYKHASEWKKSDDLTDTLCTEFPLLESAIKQMRTDVCFWDEAKSAASGNKSVTYPASEKNWYFHPIAFVEHMKKVGLHEFNPYITGHSIIVPPGYVTKKSAKTGKDRKVGSPGGIITVKDNPGFAPVYTWGNEKYEYAGVRCAAVTGTFNEDYLDVEHKPGWTYREEGMTAKFHEGVDFRGDKGTEVKSLIEGEVIAWGWNSTYGRSILIANRNDVGIYLLAHLSKYNKSVLEKKYILPLDTVGYVGTSGLGGDGKYPAHLHVSYFNANYGKDYFLQVARGPDKNDEIVRLERYKDMNSYICNPFIHSDQKISDK